MSNESEREGDGKQELFVHLHGFRDRGFETDVDHGVLRRRLELHAFSMREDLKQPIPCRSIAAS